MNFTIDKIRAWGIKCKITVNGDPKAQFIKLISEYGELCQHNRELLQLVDSEEMEDYGELTAAVTDDIGDMVVVVTMITELLDRSDVMDTVYTALTNNSGLWTETKPLGQIYGEFGDDLIKNAGQEHLNEAFFTDFFSHLFNVYGVERVERGINDSYDTIKDRVGITTPEGVFIKSTDPRYEHAVKSFG